MIATIDIFEIAAGFFRLITKAAHGLSMTPATLFVILIVLGAGLVSRAERANRRRDIERAIRESNQPKQ